MTTQLTRSFRATPRDQLVAKLYTFRRRSAWRYLLGALLLSLAQPALLGHFVLTWLGISAGLLGLGLAVVVLSSYRQLGHAAFEAQVTFQASHIEVRPADGTPPQTHDWGWVQRADESGRYFFLSVRDFPRLVLLLDKGTLSSEEAAALRGWLASAATGSAGR